MGEITGHNKVINSVDIKQSRPYRLATGSDDNCAAFFEGPPFKFKFTIGVSGLLSGVALGELGGLDVRLVASKPVQCCQQRGLGTDRWHVGGAWGCQGLSLRWDARQSPALLL